MTVNPRVVAGVYDVYYCHNCQTSNNTVNVSGTTDPTDAYPNGLRALATSVTLKSGPNNVTFDIPVAQLTATFTLGGKALPSSNENNTEVDTYLVANDTGQWHALADWFYSGSGTAGTLSPVNVNPRVVAGVYDVYYCHNCQTSNNTVNVSGTTDATDAYPNGLRALATSVTLKSGANNVTFDIPVAQLTATFTLGGKALPSSNENNTEVDTYLVAKDTGQWHALADWFYSGSGTAGTLSPVNVNPRVVAGVYDVYYCHNCQTSNNTVNVSGTTDATDAYPNGLRALATSVTLKSGANNVTFDIPVAQLTATFSLGGKALPSSNENNTEVDTYLVAKDTGQWHALADWFYSGSGTAGTLSPVNVNPRVVAGVYDVYYCHNCQTSNNTVNVSGITDPTDAYPNGLRALATSVTLKSGANNVTFDIPVAQLTATFTLGGKALPSSNENNTEVDTYLVAKDTGQWHALADWFYSGPGTAGTLSAVNVNPRVVAGVYDVYYCHNCETSNNTVNVSGITDATDAYPNGLRVVRACVSVP